MGTIGSILFWILILVIIAYVSDSNETKRFLRANPIELYFAPLLDTINNEFYEGLGKIEKIKYNRVLLINRKDSIMFDLQVKAMILHVLVHYKWFHQDRYEMLPVKLNIKQLDSPQIQKEIAREVIMKAKEIRARQITALLFS